jgi:hypothetical protein
LAVLMTVTLRTTMETIVDMHRYDDDFQLCACMVRSLPDDQVRDEAISMQDHAAHVVERIFECMNGVQEPPRNWNKKRGC